MVIDHIVRVDVYGIVIYYRKMLSITAAGIAEEWNHPRLSFERGGFHVSFSMDDI